MYHMGVRRKEGLKLYLVPEVNAAAKLQNKNRSNWPSKSRLSASSRHPAARPCELGEREKGTDDACRLGGEVHKG